MTTLYLCKMDVENTLPNGDPLFVALLGRIVEVRYLGETQGYQFIPSTAGRRTSRRVWPTANGCIPRWTESCGFTRLLDKQEFDAAQAALGRTVGDAARVREAAKARRAALTQS